MASEKIWSKEIKKYMEDIVTHPNYKGIPYKRKGNGEISWIAAKKSEIGQARIEWAEEKAKKMSLPIQPGVYAKVMLQVHPTMCCMLIYYE